MRTTCQPVNPKQSPWLAMASRFGTTMGTSGCAASAAAADSRNSFNVHRCWAALGLVEIHFGDSNFWVLQFLRFIFCSWRLILGLIFGVDVSWRFNFIIKILLDLGLIQFFRDSVVGGISEIQSFFSWRLSLMMILEDWSRLRSIKFRFFGVWFCWSVLLVLWRYLWQPP